MANTGFICQDAYLEKTKKLDDAQVGRLFRALMVYHTTGTITPLGQVEEIAFDFIREDIDKTDAAYRAKCEQNRRNRASTTVNDRQRPLRSHRHFQSRKNHRDSYWMKKQSAYKRIMIGC